MIDSYLSAIAKITKRGDAREESYYASLAALIEEFAQTKRRKKVQVTVLPKKTEAGNPDFRVWDGKHSQVGYVEAKTPGTDLDVAEAGEQLKRYISTFPNLILTDFYEFRLYRDGRRADVVILAQPYAPKKSKSVPPAQQAAEFSALVEKFLQYSLPEKFTAETLAKELATRTRFLRDQVIKEELREEASSAGAKPILGFYEAFQKHLIANLKPDEFADLYAQTITYGLFAARTRANGKFNRKLAYDLIPKTIGILREIFHFISFDPAEQLAATVDDIAEVLAVADVNNILREYYKEGKGTDPIFHFYETFLAEYNPKERERRGVYYTPEPVVSYIVRSLNIILKETFGREDGFATHSVTVLDPAGGTLTFLAAAARLAVEEYVAKYGKSSRAKFIEDHILKHFYAFELMMAPYAAGHLKMGYLLEELGHKLTGDERFQFYLTNTLEDEELTQTDLPGMASLSEESHLAAKVKREQPILVILGNPPYSGISANASEREVAVPKGQNYINGYTIQTKQEKGRVFYHLQKKEQRAKKDLRVKQKTWIGELIEYYKIVDGEWFGERKHWLQDDYVKFIRFAQWKIDQIGEGVVGFITNHAYLDNPTFRGMRQSLMNSFDEIHILDLHGNSLKKEKAPDGSQDKNVFDIQQGVAIALLVKRKTREGKCRVYHAELWGPRQVKYDFLCASDVRQVGEMELQPTEPLFFFVPKQTHGLCHYGTWPSVSDAFALQSVGFVTGRDRLTITFCHDDIWRRMRDFAELPPESARAAYELGKDSRDWTVKTAQKDVKASGPSSRIVTPILYRPFDGRYTYYTGKSRGVFSSPQVNVMRHMLQDNLALCVGRAGQVVGIDHDWNVVYCSQQMQDFNMFYRGGNVNFPLYTYPDTDKRDLFTEHGSGTRVPNLAPKLVEQLTAAYGKQPSPEDIFHYIYAILYSTAYRKKYAEFLKTDFPRVPFTKDRTLFDKLAGQGAELVGLHLLKSKRLAKPIAKCEGKGDLQVVKITYDAKRLRVMIGPDNWFAGVPVEVWEYRIGGYQVAEKWLKDRKGRTLSSEEIVTYAKVITALTETIKIQSSLDALFERVESAVLEVRL